MNVSTTTKDLLILPLSCCVAFWEKFLSCLRDVVITYRTSSIWIWLTFMHSWYLLMRKARSIHVVFNLQILVNILIRAYKYTSQNFLWAIRFPQKFGMYAFDKLLEKICQRPRTSSEAWNGVSDTDLTEFTSTVCLRMQTSKTLFLSSTLGLSAVLDHY